MSWWIVLSINCEKIVSLCHQNPPKCICFHYISDKQQIPKTEKMEQPRLFLFCFVFQHFSFKNSWIQFQLTSRSINLLIISALVLTQISFGLLWNPAVDCNQHINYANIFWADFRKMYRCFFFFFCQTCPKLYESLLEANLDSLLMSAAEIQQHNISPWLGLETLQTMSDLLPLPCLEKSAPCSHGPMSQNTKRFSQLDETGLRIKKIWRASWEVMRLPQCCVVVFPN